MTVFDTKIAIVLREDLPNWQKLNMTAFLASGIAAAPEMTGLPYEDASGRTYLPMFRQPVLVFQSDVAGLRQVYERAVARGLDFAVFTAALFSTGHDDANRAAMRAVASEALDLTGIALRAGKKDVDKVVKGLKLHE